MLHSLFWRTFGLIALLLSGSLLTWMLLQHEAQEQPRTARFAAEAAALIHLTRAGLLTASETERILLLAMLDQDESIRVLAAEDHDRVLPWADALSGQTLLTELKRRFPEARLAREVNGVAGLWIGFDIDTDPYWLLLDPQRWERHRVGLVLGGWALIAAGLALAGALWITRIVHRPLRVLAARLQGIASGQSVAPLPESGPRELRRVHRQFNHMSAELARLDEDRRVALAGISHDLRTPLTRIRLELALAGLPDETRNALDGEIALIETQIDQFIEFARPTPPGPWQPVDLSVLVPQFLARLAWGADELAPDCHLSIPPGTTWAGPPTELQRLLSNLVRNAVRHGASADGQAHLDIAVRAQGPGIVLELRDHGPGLAGEDADRLLRPFERGVRARTGAGGSGLGLAIVSQIARRHGGAVRLTSPGDGGLQVQVSLQNGAPPYSDPLWRPTAIDQIN